MILHDKRRPEGSRARLTELDALRGLAVLVVVVYHYFHEFPLRYDSSIPVIKDADYGKYGVELFFMISGFVIYMTVERSDRPKDFVLGRFSRLYPACWVASLATFIVISTSPLPDVHLRPVHFLVNLTMLEGFVHTPYVDGAYWSLTIELSFYFLVLFLMLCKRTRWTLVSLWVAVVVFLLGRAAWNHGVRNRLTNLLFNSQTLLSYAHLFAAGIVFFLIVVKKQRSAVLYVQLATVPVVDAGINGFRSAVVIALAMGVMAGSLLVRPAWLRIRPILFLGGISYSLYLVHQRIGYVSIRELDRHGMDHWLSVSVTIVVAIAAATLLNIFVERPAQALIRRRLRARVLKTSTQAVPGPIS